MNEHSISTTMVKMYKNTLTTQRFFSPRALLTLLLLTLVYWISAQPGVMFVTHGIYASLIWPPAGISLAALLVFGYRAWPGILAGAFFTEVGLGIPGGAAAIIAIGDRKSTRLNSSH